jgi:glycosyltransferase involved in cell wall biosynthesis
MRISIVYNTALYVYKFRMNLIKALQDQGHEVIVIAPRDEYVDQLEVAGIQFIDLPIAQYGMNPLTEIKGMVRLWKIFSKVKPDISLHYTIKPNIFGNLAARLAKVRVINNIAGGGRVFSSSGQVLKFIVKSLLRISLSKSSHVFFQNRDDFSDFDRMGLIDIQRASRIPGSGVDLTNFTVYDMGHTPVFLFVGRLLKEKGIEEFVDAATRLKEKGLVFEALIVGEHEERDDNISTTKLNSAIDQNIIEYVGAVSPDRIPELLERSTCVVLPSTYGEGVPRSLLEASASGRPIITTNSRGCRDALEDGVTGIMIENRSSLELSEAMAKFIEMPREKWIEMGQAGRAKMETEFAEQIVLDSYLRKIESLSQ